MYKLPGYWPRMGSDQCIDVLGDRQRNGHWNFPRAKLRPERRHPHSTMEVDVEIRYCAVLLRKEFEVSNIR